MGAGLASGSGDAIPSVGCAHLRGWQAAVRRYDGRE